MATYLVLEITVGPCLDQQVHNAVVAFACGKDERRPAILHHEWTWGGNGGQVNHRVGGGQSGTGVECEGVGAQ